MRIGVDLDNTIFCTNEQYKKYQYEFLCKKNITEEELWANKKYRVEYIRNNLSKIFSDVKLKPNVIKVLNELKKNNHEIYIITARSIDYSKDIYQFTKDSIDINKIPYDKLILSEKYKLANCIENNIDIMIDDSIDVYNELNSKINVLLFDDFCNHENIKNRVSSWDEVYERVEG